MSDVAHLRFECNPYHLVTTKAKEEEEERRKARQQRHEAAEDRDVPVRFGPVRF